MKRIPVRYGPKDNPPPQTPRHHLRFRNGARWLTAVFGLLLAGAVQAIPITIIDDAGPDDEPGQKDLNQLTVDFDPVGTDLAVTWNWDVTSVSGANTGDACSLLDTDNDGNANFSLCVIWGDGATYETMRLYSCGDGAADKCDQPRALLAEDMNLDGDIADAGEALVGGPYGSSCTLSEVDDIFGARGGSPQASTEFDTQASCSIELDDFGGLDAFLLNVCSYPSQVPGSDPSDCVITPNSGFLTLIKVADPDDPSVPFNFALGAGQAANNGDTSFIIDGSGTLALIGFDADTTYDLTEIVPDGWQLDSASCELSNGTSTGTLSGATVTDFTIQIGRETTCTFNNSLLPATLTVIKKVENDNGGTAAPDDFNLTVNDNPVLSGATNEFDAGDYTVAETLLPGYSAGAWGGDCAADGTITLAPGQAATCTITNDDISPTLTVIKTVVNDNGGTAAPDDFNLTVNGNPVLTGVSNNFNPGDYTVAETPLAGYSAGPWGGDCAADGSITLALGDNATCTITNDDISPTLTVIKTVVNDNGGTAVVNEFNLTVDGDSVLSGATNDFDAGGHTVAETPLAGYSAGPWGGDCAADGSITLALGENATCTITNDDISPTLTVIKTVMNDNGGTAKPDDFNLTIDGGTVLSGVSNDFNAGGHTVAETPLAGYSAGAWGGDCAADGSITLALGDNATCTITNDDIAPSLTLIKTVENGANPGGTAVETDWTLTATGPTGFSGPTGVTSDASFDAGSYDLSESGPAGYIASNWACVGGTQNDGDTVLLGLGENATCTITNTAMGMSTLLKLTNGVENQAMTWNFTLQGPGVDESDSSPPTTVDFGGIKLIPSEEYTLCETGIPAGWTLEWQVDTDGDGIPDTIIPQVAGVNNDAVGATGYSRVYDPNYVAPPGTFTNDTRCVNFVVDVGETLAFQIDNQFPGGEPRTIGYWKNWNTCTGGNQAATAANNGGTAEGWFILDDLLNNPGYTIGILQLDSSDCPDAVSILDKRSIDDGKKRASDGAYNLASQLLAAQLNLSAGAETCQAVVDAVNDGQTLLAGEGFDGTGGYLKGRQAGEANALASTLDEYNNGNLCSP